jgi:hypothetical protein
MGREYRCQTELCADHEEQVAAQRAQHGVYPRPDATLCCGIQDR